MNALSDFADALRRRLAADVRTDPMSRLLYSTDASNYQIMPLAVVMPRSADDIVAAVEEAARFGLPILPRGGGTSLAGQAVNACIVIDTSKHVDRILEINAEERWARIRPGVVMDILNRKAAPFSLVYGPDPASGNRATMGGIIANNATGSHSIVYGMTADHVLEVTTVLSDGSVVTFGPAGAREWAARAKGGSLEARIYRGVGEIVERDADLILAGFPEVWRRANGYNLDRLVQGWPRNLASLIVGSEGTLAFIIEAKVRLSRKPAHTALAIFHFDNLIEALRQVPQFLEHDVSAVELTDRILVELTRSSPFKALADWIQGDPEALLMVEVSGDAPKEVRAKLDKVAALQVGQRVVVRAETPQTIADVWAVRKAALGILMSRRGDYKQVPFIEDTAVPVERLADYVAELRRVLAAHGKEAAYFAHASAGELHIRPMLNLKDADEIATMQAISEATFELVKSLGGATAGEHGDGITRSWFNRRLFGDALFERMVQVKRLFDPENRFNPNRVVGAPPLTENLRYGPAYRTTPPPHRTHFDWSAWGGYSGAVEMCNGSAECRKLGEGVMCPSFMATREEANSARGRANVLRAALSGQWPGGLTDEAVKEALDLCLECKSCKAECPSAVDMARLKSEWLAQYQAEHGVPLRSLVFGYIALVSRLAQPFAPLANAALSSPPVRRVMEAALKIDARRPMPKYVSHTFKQWFNRRPTPAHLDGRPEVVLFPDTYLMFNYPHIGKAAVRVLEALGYGVRLGPDICCGRPMISKGLLGAAKRQGERLVAALANATEGFQLPVVAIEPSCLLTFRDEYLVLLDDQRKKDLAGVSFTFEEFVAAQVKGGSLPVALHPDPGQVLLHGHCYQKALVGTNPAEEALRAFGYEVSMIDAGCCGMAGAFGYESEHYEISRQVAEDRLLPAIRAAKADDLIAADGVSCRAQIADLGGREAMHPAEVMAAALLEE